MRISNIDCTKEEKKSFREALIYFMLLYAISMVYLIYGELDELFPCENA